MTTLVDDYGRRVVFEGEQLVGDTTDTSDGRKPQWLDIDIWRTDGGNYVVKRAVRYRVVHASENCARAEGYELVTGTGSYPCNICNTGKGHSGWVQTPRVTVEVFNSPEEFIESLKVDGRHSRMARAILAEMAEQDTRIDALWNTVIVK
jgi:hypothetical protein